MTAELCPFRAFLIGDTDLFVLLLHIFLYRFVVVAEISFLALTFHGAPACLPYSLADCLSLLYDLWQIYELSVENAA